MTRIMAVPVSMISLAVLVILLSVAGSDGPQALAGQQTGLATAPSCFNDKGETVQFIISDRGRTGLAVGMATRNADGVPTVVRSNFSAAPMEFQQFIDRHECAHHQTGDVDRPHPPRNSAEHLMIESIADCVAIRRLRDEEGFGRKSLDIVTSALRTDMQKIGFPEISITSRIRNVSGCFDNPDSGHDLVNQVLKQRGLLQ